MTERITDQRRGAGHVPLASVTLPTFDIPGDCMCSWSVIRPGRGRECISALKYRNTLCSHRHARAVAASG